MLSGVTAELDSGVLEGATGRPAAPSLHCIPRKRPLSWHLVVDGESRHLLNDQGFNTHLNPPITEQNANQVSLLLHCQENCGSKRQNNLSVSKSYYVLNQNLSSGQTQAFILRLNANLFFSKSVLAFKEGKRVWKNYHMRSLRANLHSK